MRAALRDADSYAAGALQSVVVGMGGPTVRGANGRGVLELGYVQEVQQTDVRRVMERASSWRDPGSSPSLTANDSQSRM